MDIRIWGPFNKKEQKEIKKRIKKIEKLTWLKEEGKKKEIQVRMYYTNMTSMPRTAGKKKHVVILVELPCSLTGGERRTVPDELMYAVSEDLNAFDVECMIVIDRIRTFLSSRN